MMMNNPEPAAQNGQLNLPPEMWTLIFNHLNEPRPSNFRRHRNGNGLVGMRRVCKFWRQVIDDHIGFEVTVDEGFDSARYAHLRVGHLIIKNATAYLTQDESPSSSSSVSTSSRPFSDQRLFTNLTLDCSITRENLFALISKFTNVEMLSIQPKFYEKLDLFVVPPTQEQAQNLTKFLGKLKKLALDKWIPSSREYYLHILSSDMPKLKTVSICMSDFHLDDSGILPFLKQRAPKLENLRIEYASESELLKERTQNVVPPTTSRLEIKLSQLRSLDITTIHLSANDNLMPLLREQRSLEKLCIQICSNPRRAERATFQLHFTEIEESLLQNVKTLKSLKLGNILLSAPLNESLFRGMTNLRELTLLPMKGSTPAHGFNLSILPDSIEKLIFRGFPGGNQIKKFEAPNLKNLKLFDIDEIDLKSNLPNPALPVSNLFSQIIMSEVMNLTVLSLRFKMFNLDDSGLLPFFMEKAPNLKHLNIFVWKEYMPHTCTYDKLVCNLDLGPMHLQSIELTLEDKCCAATWIPLLKLQRSLEVLHFRHSSPDFHRNECLAFSDLEETLALNKKTLTSLSLGEFTLSENIDASIFQEMEKLKELKLHHHQCYSRNREFKIFNLSKLPNSVKRPRIYGLRQRDDADE